MRFLAGFATAFLLSTAVFAQGRGGGFSGAQPKVTGSFGSVVFPGGTPATSPGVQRSFGSTNFPGGGGPHLNVPNTKNLTLSPRRGLGSYGAQFGYGIPWFYYGPDYFNQPEMSVPDQRLFNPTQPAAAVSPSNSPNVVIVYPPQAAQQAPVQEDANWRVYPPQQTAAPAAAPEAVPEAPNYLLAFKDHNIYPTVAYWIDGNTIHYITSGNRHNQATIDLLDRPLTERLSKDAGYEVKLP
jgi:hypothetical protein